MLMLIITPFSLKSCFGSLIKRQRQTVKLPSSSKEFLRRMLLDPILF